MKISQASKKVLASALSAAMVVAFAPTVAFGATGDKVAVTVDVAGGTATTTAFPNAAEGQTLTLDTAAVSADGYALDYWYIDKNLDGKYVDTEDVMLVGGSLELTSTNITDGAVTVRAVYKDPASIDDDIAFTEDAAAKTASIVIGITKNDVKAADYTLTVKNPAGVVVGSKTYEKASATEGPATFADFTLNFSENPVQADIDAGSAAKYSQYIAGEWTFELSDGSKIVSSKKVSLLNLTIVDGTNKTTTKVQTDTEGAATVTLDNSGDKAFLDADGYVVADEDATAGIQTTITADATFTKVAAATQYVTVAPAYTNRQLSFSVADTATDGTKYAVRVTDPTGAVVYSTDIASTSGAALSTQALSFTFDQNDPAKVHAANGATEVAGTYVVSVEKTAGNTVTSAKAKLVLTELKVDYASSAVSNTDTFAVVAAGAKLTTTQTAEPGTLPSGKAFDAWTFNGEAIETGSTPAYKVGEVNTLVASYKDAARTKLAAPTATVTKELVQNTTDTYQYVIKPACTDEGVAFTYKLNGAATETAVSADGIVIAEADFATTTTVEIYANPVTGITENGLAKSDALTLVTVGTAGDAIVGLMGTANTGLEKYIGKSETKWYSVESIKAAYQGAVDAIAASYYATADEWGSLAAAQAKNIEEAAAAYADKVLTSFADGAYVVYGEKAYELSADKINKANSDIATATKNLKDTSTAGDYTTALNGIIAAVNTALDSVTAAAVTPADIETAKAVDEAIAALPAEVTKDNYEAVAEAAAAAQAAYEALTDEQKKLVAGDIQAITKAAAAAEAVKAEIAAAEEAAAAEKAAAEALAAAQDQAAVNLVNSTKSKTVKLTKGVKKTKKAQTVKWTSKVSASGNVVTYAKKSGSAKITIAAGGTAKLKKATKKGTYTAKVTVTCGAATRTVTVKFVVK